MVFIKSDMESDSASFLRICDQMIPRHDCDVKERWPTRQAKMNQPSG